MEILELKNTVTEIKSQFMGAITEWRGEKKELVKWKSGLAKLTNLSNRGKQTLKNEWWPSRAWLSG